MPATKHSVILCHPCPESFTHSVAERYARTVREHGHHAQVRDLYALGFNPVLSEEERRGDAGADIAEELRLLEGTDVFVLVYPIWFGTPPAMMKGYIERVFGAGCACGAPSEGMGRSVLAGRQLVSFTSSGSMQAWLDERGVLMSMQNLFVRYLAELFGVAETSRRHFDGITSEVPERDLRFHLAEVEKAAVEVMSRFAFDP